MTNIDDRIRDALNEDDKAFLASLDEGRGMFSQVGDVLTGPLGGWSKLIFAVSIAVGFALVYCAYRTFTADTLELSTWWGVITLALLMMQGFIKEWFYSRMNMLSVLREVKRLQLQVSMLEDKRG